MSAGRNFVFELTPSRPDIAPKIFLTQLEANRERRRLGGGTIRQVPAPRPASAPVMDKSVVSA